MRLIPLTAVAAAAILVLAAVPADAQRRSGVANEPYPGASTMQRTRIMVRPRSFLDAGTKVQPGSQRYHDYATSPLFMYPTRIADPTGSFRSPLPGAFGPAGWLP